MGRPAWPPAARGCHRGLPRGRAQDKEGPRHQEWNQGALGSLGPSRQIAFTRRGRGGWGIEAS